MRLADQEHRSPLRQIAERANNAMASAGIINRHNRRPPLYAEATLETFAKLGFAIPDHFPLIRAAGHLAPPPFMPASHNIDSIISDIAAYMARSHEPQNADDILQFLDHRQEALDKWPQLDLTLFIHRTAGIRPDDHKLYHADQPWGNFITTQRLVANTVLRVLARDQKPCATAYLVDEIKRLVGHHLPDRYNILNAVRNFAYTSEEVHRQSMSTFGLKAWYAVQDVQNPTRRRGRAKDIAHAFLKEQGPAKVEDVIKHVQQVAQTTRRTVQDVINHDRCEHFIRTPDGLVAANPLHRNNDADNAALTVVQDHQRRRPGPVLRQSELLWTTHYVRALDEMAPPLPARVMLTGPRANGFALEDPMEIVVVADDRNRPNLEPQLAEIAAASEAAASVKPSISIISPQQWDHQQATEGPEVHYNVWLAPGEAT